MAAYGFLGTGIMGCPMAENLLRAGYEVVVWNRDSSKCRPLLDRGAIAAESPQEVARRCETTFAILADPAASREVCLGQQGVLAGIGDGRGYVDMSTVDPGTSRELAEKISGRGGRFLEAPVSGSKKPAEDGALVILAAGDHSLFEDVAPAFEAMGKRSFFLGEVGNGARMKLVINQIMAAMMAALSEGLSLGQKAGLAGEDILEVLAAGALANPMFALKGKALLDESYAVNFPLKHMQKDLRLALAMSEELGQPLSVAVGVNEIFKRACAADLGEEDFSAIHKVLK
mgnify:CR=1 FL=1